MRNAENPFVRGDRTKIYAPLTKPAFQVEHAGASCACHRNEFDRCRLGTMRDITTPDGAGNAPAELKLGLYNFHLEFKC